MSVCVKSVLMAIIFLCQLPVFAEDNTDQQWRALKHGIDHVQVEVEVEVEVW
jgi:hypothetical protein